MRNKIESKYWIQTVSGKHFHLWQPNTEEIDIRDIAHGLSMLCRFTGHLPTFYSVAEHSIRTANLAPKDQRLATLLHDSAEAYIGDLNSPLKSLLRSMEDFGMSSYDVIEEDILRLVFKKYNIVDADWNIIHNCDSIMGITEAKFFMQNLTGWDGYMGSGIQPLPGYNIKPMTPDEAEVAFLRYFRYYGGKE